MGMANVEHSNGLYAVHLAILSISARMVFYVSSGFLLDIEPIDTTLSVETAKIALFGSKLR